MKAFIAVQTSPPINVTRPPEVARLIVLAENEADALAAFQSYVQPNDTVALANEQPDSTWVSEQRAEKALLPGKVQPYAAPLK